MALTAGQIVYIRSKNTRLLKDPKVDSINLAFLQPCSKVVWLEKANAEFHKVRAGNKTGYVFFSNLSKEFPNPQYISSPPCMQCNGEGYLSLPGIDYSTFGNNFVRPMCQACKGTGHPPARSGSFHTSGATKA